jgi:hypothetical protein
MEGNKIQINTEKAEGEDFVCVRYFGERGDFLAHDLSGGFVAKLCHI